jgi:hypothetical protein
MRDKVILYEKFYIMSGVGSGGVGVGVGAGGVGVGLGGSGIMSGGGGLFGSVSIISGVGSGVGLFFCSSSLIVFFD